MNKYHLGAVLIILAALTLYACNNDPGRPTIAITSPPHGSQYQEGEAVAVQSTATDPDGVVRVELLVDGVIVQTDSPPNAQGQASFTLLQRWTATAGSHTISVRAFDTKGVMSEATSVVINVAAAVVTATGTPTTSAPPLIPSVTPEPFTLTATSTPTTVPTLASTPASPNVGCTNNATYIADVTIPDGTAVGAGQTFSKVWRMRNTGTCVWSSGYEFVFIAGESMAAVTTLQVSYVAPGETTDLGVTMTAPSATGAHSGQWRMRTAGNLFGDTFTVLINVPGTPPPPPVCSGVPIISSFTASPSSITIGQSSTLSWGAVTNASSVDVDNGIGGVSTPGSLSVTPGSTTTYTLTARCGSNVQTAQVTVTVNAAPKPDLYVSEFSLNPNPPLQNGNVHVRVGVYNGGNAPAGSFTVQWFAGSGYATPACTWPVGSLPAHGGQILECDRGPGTWASQYASIVTRVKVDTGNTVAESNEGNNIRDMTISVAIAKPDLYVSEFSLSPNPPNHNLNVDVRIGVYNQGNAAAGSFRVEWWAGKDYVTGPACVWIVPGLPAHGGQILTCHKGPGTWASQYPSIVTRVKVDSLGAINESNESNNIYDLTIKVQ